MIGTVTTDAMRRAPASGANTVPDGALVAKMAGGDADALAALYDRYAGEIYRLVMGMVSDPEGAEELLQDIFWQAWRLASRYDPTLATVRTWLHVLMRSRAADWRRRAARTVPVAAWAEAPPRADPGAGPAFEHLETRCDLLQACDQLREVERQAIEWTFLAGLTQAEAAEHLGLPLGTVKSRVRTALRRLREHLGESDRGGPKP